MKSKTNLYAILSLCFLLGGAFIFFMSSDSGLYKGPVVAKTPNLDIHVQDVNRYAALRSSAGANFDLMTLNDAAQRKVIEDYVYNLMASEESDSLNLMDEAELEEQVKLFRLFLKRNAYEQHLSKQAAKEDEIKKGYVNLQKSVKGKIQIKTSHILLKTKKEANALRKKLNKKNFAELAKEKSIDLPTAENGGQLGYLMKGQMIKEFEEAAMKLKVGEISKPVETKFGWHLIQLEDKRQAQIRPYNELRGGIVQGLANRKIMESRNEILKNAKIDYFLNDLSEGKSKKEVVK